LGSTIRTKVISAPKSIGAGVTFLLRVRRAT
jgi:hypothetical protein